MSKQQIHDGRWNSIKGQLQEKWGELTDNDIRKAEGDFDKLVGVIQKRTGQARKQIEAALGDIVDDSATILGAATETVRDAAHRTSNRIQHEYERVSDRVREGYDMARGRVKRKPIASITTAFGSGLIVGAILGVFFRSR